MKNLLQHGERQTVDPSTFIGNPEWQKKCGETEADGPILTGVSNQSLQPMAFSPATPRKSKVAGKHASPPAPSEL